MRYLIAAFTLLLSSNVANAQFVPFLGELPARNDSRTITVGANLFETFNYSVAPGVRIDNEARIVQKDGSTIRIGPGTILYLWRDDKKPKACLEPPVTTLYSNPCAIDMDGDGDFDRLAPNEIAGAKDLLPSVPYLRGQKYVSTVGAGTFKNVLIYQGFAKSILRISYREFSNDFARAAFTEEYTFELSDSFPQEVAIRNQVFVIESASAKGLTYFRK